MSSSHAAHAPHDGKVHAHVSSFGFLVAIFLTLIVLTVVTVGASYFDFGSANTLIAVLIATVKATLVALFFMHLRYDKPFHGMVFVASFVFLGTFLLLTMDDLTTRGIVEPANGAHVNPRTGEPAPGGMPGGNAPSAHH